ncbi:MAG TPA: DUF4215 domain-containing protein [Polyangiaceae bacterium]|nr:DUF4215 domain-containing protein [Polyangiaceae bacterium]
MGRYPRHRSPGALLASSLLLGGAALSGCSPAQDADRQITVVRPGEPAPPETREAAPTVPEATEADLRLVEAPPPPFCGDGALNDDEQCDDGNETAGDGCSANCLVVEQGYACPTPGGECVLVARCGDSLQIGEEQCDDGNVLGDDGCTATCQLERDYVCPTPGQPCVSSVTCGDRRLSGDEKCDDGNTTAGDGCSATCTSEEGFTCPITGALCVAVCGDGLVRGAERCDDANTTPGDGCSATCGNEDGFACGAPGQLCFETTCGDGSTEGSEGCDDGAADRPFDGCFQCVREPECTLGECDAVCGDGLRYTGEACDDGNTNDGDGCSATCQIEAGFDCPDQGGTGGAGDTFILPVVYRDFVGVDTSGDGAAAARVTARATAGISLHPDFNTFQGTGVLGAVGEELGADGLPVFACDAGVACATNFTSAQRFDQWYFDTPGVNLPVVDQLTLGAIGNGAFLFDSADLATTDNGQFDPLLDAGFQARAVGGVPLEGHEFCDVDLVPNPDGPDTPGATPRNMSFTTETRFVFEYVGNERFEFSGDDDVWVFVNNRLVVDLGGLHEVATGSFTLDDAGVATVEREGPAGSALTLAASIEIDTGMRLNQVYEAVLFHAERHECGSNFKLTLAGFDKPRSACHEVCGDGVVTRSETCDDGPLNGTGYGVCAADCTPGPRCGDGEVNGGSEVCDDGLNVALYSRGTGACGPGCSLPSSCGDGVVDPTFGETCDDGVNDNSYGGCSDTCELGPRCGDNVINGDEECDDGNRINGDTCNINCRNERLPA